MRSLIQDIRSAAKGIRPGDPVRAVRDAVVAHLRDLCATPRGKVLLARDYGIDDPTRLFHEYPHSVADMERHLLGAIVRFEPRLANVSVTHVKTDDLELLLRFDVEGILMSEGRALPVRFSTVIDSDNHVELR
ncbi:MAG: type VI secretion system baseplate subunit TssE [Polyangiaceae bacterium]